jgi:hypothetical protein
MEIVSFAMVSVVRGWYKMRPSTMILTALYIFDGVRVAEFGGTEEGVVGFVEGDGNDIGRIVGVGGAEMGSHADDEERAGVVLACSYSGVVSYGVGVEEKRFGEFDGFRDVGTAGTC